MGVSAMSLAACRLLPVCNPTPDISLWRNKRAYVPNPDISLLHSITSSARAMSVAGISIPSALAVLRLIASSNFVG